MTPVRLRIASANHQTFVVRRLSCRVSVCGSPEQVLSETIRYHFYKSTTLSPLVS